MRKKLLALLLAAALALSLLAGCGGESVASALLKLLEGRYPNISIEIDPELEADLRQAIRKAEAENAGDDAAVIRAALEKLVGSTVTFRKLGEGQQGDTTFDLVFYSGSDPDKAAQAAYSQWHPILSNVPDDGQYDTSLAMVETNSGVWMLVKATVEKAGTVDKPDKDDDEPETQEPKDPYTDNGKNSYTVNTKDGLQKLYNDLKGTSDFATAKITLNSSATLGQEWPVDITFTGELNGNNHKITMTGTRTQGLFNEIGASGLVQNVDIEVSGTIYNSSYDVGAVAGTNGGTVTGCSVTGGSISSSGISDGVGGVVGFNFGGSVNNCYSTNAVNGGYAGGVVGYNYNGGTVNDCYSTGTVSCGSAGGYAGGVVGLNSQNSSVTGCYHADGEVSGGIAGGVVGWNDSSTVTACYSTGTVTGTQSSGFTGTGGVVGFNYNGGTVTACYHAGTVQGGSKNGGVVGRNWTGGTVNDCYWSGQVSSYGIGYDDYYISPTNVNANQVTANGDTDPTDGIVNWETALAGLNGQNTGYTFGGEDMNNPTLTKN